MQDHLLPQFNTTKKTVWADRKVILIVECILLKLVCVLLKGKAFEPLKTSPLSLIMGKGMSACLLHVALLWVSALDGGMFSRRKTLWQRT